VTGADASNLRSASGADHYLAGARASAFRSPVNVSSWRSADCPVGLELLAWLAR